MPASGVRHVALTVNDWGKSMPFYRALAEALGATPFIDAEGPPHRANTRKVPIFASKSFMFSKWEALKENKVNRFTNYNDGLRHFCVSSARPPSTGFAISGRKRVGRRDRGPAAGMQQLGTGILRGVLPRS